LFNLFINDVFLAISIIPFHKHIVPKNVIESSTASAKELKIPVFRLSIFPEKTAYINDKIIKIGNNIFNIYFTYSILFYNYFIYSLLLCSILSNDFFKFIQLFVAFFTYLCYHIKRFCRIL